MASSSVHGGGIRGGLLASALVVGLAFASAPREASACGGTFCDSGPGAMPVDQTGETILFAIDNGYVEAHVQIEYDGGDAEQFAWVVPVPAIPELEVGSWRLVQAALDSTRPVYGYQNQAECEETAAADDSGVIFLLAPDGGGGSPTVVAEDVVGAFEYAVLQGGSAQTVTQWLQDHDYAVDALAPDILDEYIAEGHVFVAFRLRHGQGVTDIHPVVIRYPGSEPCIPIRLTRVAAKEDMDIRALFLGESRVVPTNYRHVWPNRTRLDWLRYGANYRELVTMAVDAPVADGHAFVTEHAGSSAVIDRSLLDTTGLDSGVFEGLPPVDVVDVLEVMGLARCDEDSCRWQHELVLSLLHEFLPAPPELGDHLFYSCLSCYAGLIDAQAWDAAAFAAAFDERIVGPLLHAQELLDTWPYVTRLYTTISPHEMTLDPMFAESPGLPDVVSRHGAARERDCCGTAMRLPGGRLVWYMGNRWPVWEDDMPWAERIEEYAPGGGAPVVLVDEGAVIDAVLVRWNGLVGCEDLGTGTGLDSGPGTSTSTGGAGEPSAQETAGDGCACTTRSGGPAGSLLLLLLGLGGLVRRRPG
ncbi:DUF2330 domain-containing protein [Paraliomyxa miuraensis]|uniref:DUF2330 domain-containing protein n=1 Tax=Paraliomyxa miuraensis TaxID=376150 RepID=UPI002258E4C3|nr:DUF2330 domain-containing protein [Paraliomyxa miuraensis]MCX4247934.1 DUF2330 domain-containing protein [Paraliomyxa miuraensis]